jgi:TonB family protein
MKWLLAIVSLSLINYWCSFAQNTVGEDPVLFEELFKNRREGNKLILVWWLAEQFWDEVAKGKEGGTSEAMKQFTKLSRDHLIIAASEGEIGAFGGITWRNEEEVRERIQVFDQYNVGYGPIASNKLKPDIKNLFAIMKPIMSNMIGAVGEGLQWFVFPSTSSDGARIADAATTGSFSVKVGDNRITWDLPLESLEARKACSVCSQSFRGRYKFCPYDATVLSYAKPSSAAIGRSLDTKKSLDGIPPPDFVAIEKEPVVVKSVAPLYPELAMRAGLEGKVLIKIWVDKNGKPKKVEIVRSDAEIFNAPSIEAGKQFLFTPAYLNGKPVDVWVTIPFNFRLVDKTKDQ